MQKKWENTTTVHNTYQQEQLNVEKYLLTMNKTCVMFTSIYQSWSQILINKQSCSIPLSSGIPRWVFHFRGFCTQLPVISGRSSQPVPRGPAALPLPHPWPSHSPSVSSGPPAAGSHALCGSMRWAPPAQWPAPSASQPAEPGCWSRHPT